MSDIFSGDNLNAEAAGSISLFEMLVQAKAAFGADFEIIEDRDYGVLSYAALIRAALAFAHHLSGQTDRGERVGVFLPTSVPPVIVFFALHAIGRVPVMFNYAHGRYTLSHSAKLAGVNRILSSKTFIKKGGFEDVEDSLSEIAKIDHLEDMKRELSVFDKIKGAAGEKLPILTPEPPKPHDEAVIVFTSGTTGEPKGIALSHGNLISNIEQIRQHVDMDRHWVFFNPLPIFHCFGLTGGTLLPILSGLRTVFHPTPLEKGDIVSRIQSSAANTLIATDSFARLYARSEQNGELEHLKYIVLGGEKVEAPTRKLMAKKSSAEIVEGYGLSETSPVAALNKLDDNREESVGLLLPGMEATLENVEGIEAGKQLLLRGPNVMLGYINPDSGEIERRDENEWFETGDLAELDDDGYLKITGRIKRFAKIGGEMISLDIIEQSAHSLWEDASHAAMSVSNGEGESIALITDQQDAGQDQFSKYVKDNDLDRKTIPKHFVIVDDLPLLPMGTPDYQKIRDIVRDELDAEPKT